ncbi:hypothetical protein [Macrococcus bovicus]|uniref:Uncharacterized protein n=1 Tax=Macrococcus bovicus TaxID=69968 RepID=A0A4R6BWC0_9STAP|nr:hypothetical protein [Macrococcus bovicus]TDM12649.1 hypothetical protein ERX55_10350 [Macrococcus bovicus]
MNWIICYKLIDGKYVLSRSGSDLVVSDIFDKTLPVREEVARQAYKLEYDGENLRLKDGEKLLSLEELNAEQQQLDTEKGLVVEEVSVPQLVEVVL